MPTAYTKIIEEDGNLDAKEYLKRCSRAFDMFSHQRDESLDVELRYPEPEYSYLKGSLSDAREELMAAEHWTQDQIAEKHREYVARAIAGNEKSIQRAQRVNSRYEAVLSKISQWDPEDEASQAVKKFALEQIALCYPAKAYTFDPELSPSKWYADHIDGLRRNVHHYVERVEQENAREFEQRLAIKKFLIELESVPE